MSAGRRRRRRRAPAGRTMSWNVVGGRRGTSGDSDSADAALTQRIDLRRHPEWMMIVHQGTWMGYAYDAYASGVQSTRSAATNPSSTSVTSAPAATLVTSNT